MEDGRPRPSFRVQRLAQSQYEQHHRERNDEYGSDGVEVSGEPPLFFAIFESRKERRSITAG